MAIINSDPKKLFAANLNYLMKLHKLTQYEVAEKIDVGANTISMWVGQRRFPGADAIEKLSVVFNLPVAWFFVDRVNNPEPEDDGSLRIESNEMEPILTAGDTVHFKMTRNVQSGSLAVINYNGTLIVRRIYYSPDNVTLSCANSAYAPLVYPRNAAPSVMGLVTKVERPL